MMSLKMFCASLFALFTLSPGVVQSDGMYRWIDENGVTHFSDEEPSSGAKRVYPSGMSVIPMRDNIRTQQNIERIRRQQVLNPSRSSTVHQSVTGSDLDEYHKKRQEALLHKRCEGYVARIDWIEDRLRAGNYSIAQGNRWRAERRDLSSKRAWECLRNN